MTNTEEYLYQFYKQNSPFTEAGIAALMGNEEVESSFNPGAYNAGEGAHGISQWEGGRFPALQAYAESIGKSWDDAGTQAAFTLHEMKTSYPEVYDFLSKTNDPSAAAAYVDQYYEGSAGTTRQQRISDASNIYGDIATNKPLTMGTSTSASLTGWSIPVGPIGKGIIGGIPGILAGGSGGIGGILTGMDNFFQYLLWIFNLDHFMKFLLYTWGVVFIIAGMLLIIFAVGKNNQTNGATA